MNLSTVLQNRINIAKQEATTTGINKKNDSYREIDFLYENVKDLCNETYRLWYCKQFNIIGRERILILASQARADGKDSVRLFSHLIKKQIKDKNK